jgi:serine/threonine protein phosphatase PrpC
MVKHMEKYRCEIFGQKVKGSLHEIAKNECQDSFKTDDIKINKTEIRLLAVSDGHGSPTAKYSKDGSEIASITFCEVMKEYIKKNESTKLEKITELTGNLRKEYRSKMDRFVSFLNREGSILIAKKITQEWKEKILKKHKTENREEFDNSGNKLEEKEIIKKYGATLIGLVIAPTFIFAFQLGDGDIVKTTKNEVKHVICSDKLLGVETHSIGSSNAWQNVNTKTIRRNIKEDLPYAYFLTTDGFANSYATDNEFLCTIKDYFMTILEYGADGVKSNLEDWLNETSAHGCGDDITMVISYICEDN